MTVGSAGMRVSNNLLSQIASRNINQNMIRMLDLQNQLASGLRLYKPSVDPAGAAVALSFQSLIERREQGATNVSRANASLTAADSALEDLQDLLNGAASIASTNIGAGSDNQTRENAAAVVAGLIEQLAQIANRQYQGRYLFGGTESSAAPFNTSDGVIRFVGDNGLLTTVLDSSTSVTTNVTAGEAFGTLSSSITSTNDLNPNITLATRLSELNGGGGVRLGTINLSDGVTATSVDLSNCDTVRDVINAINNNGVVTVTAAINAAGNGLVIQADPGDTISVTDLPGGLTARDLGIVQTTPLPAGTNLVGGDLNRKLSALTEVSALRGGAGIDTASGLLVTVGTQSEVIDLSTASTFEDVLNAIKQSGLNLRASIDSAGKRLVITNTTSGESMYVGENGGTTATDLGVRSLTTATLLNTLNEGLGVRRVTGADDFRITTRDGSVIDVDLGNATSLLGVMVKITADAQNGGRVSVALNSDGNGLQLTDNTVGAGNFKVTRLNGSYASTDLGIEKTVAAGVSVIRGDDVNPIAEDSVFRRLYDLRDALLANDDAAISNAGSGIQAQISRVSRIRGTVGARMQLLETTQTRMEDEVLQLKDLLSQVRDLDYASAVSQFQTLQATLQASLQTAGAVLPVSLMDFINF